MKPTIDVGKHGIGVKRNEVGNLVLQRPESRHSETHPCRNAERAAATPPDRIGDRREGGVRAAKKSGEHKPERREDECGREELQRERAQITGKERRSDAGGNYRGGYTRDAQPQEWLAPRGIDPDYCDSHDEAPQPGGCGEALPVSPINIISSRGLNGYWSGERDAEGGIKS